MTTSLSSDVPVGYFSWAEYDIMAPVQPKNESALAAAFISNCGARNFRLQALEALERENIKIDSYGGCHRNRDGRGMKHCMFNHVYIFMIIVYESVPCSLFKSLNSDDVYHSMITVQDFLCTLHPLGLLCLYHCLPM